MPTREILQLGNPVLWQKSVEVADIQSTESRDIVSDLSDTLALFRRSAGYGRGIAAPQLGILKRVIFVRMQPDGFCGALFNPQISWASDETFELWDDCFSFPDLLVRVSRAARIIVDFQNDRGQREALDAVGDLSELLQHEIDHLNGVLALQRAVSPQAFATRAEWKRLISSSPAS